MAFSPGETLKNKREEKKLSLDQAAEGTNIRIQYLQAIEEDRMGAISSQPQMRGFIRLYAAYLGLKPQDLLEPVETVQITPVVVDKPQESTPESIQEQSVLQKIQTRMKKQPVIQEKPVKQIDESTPEKPSDKIFKEIGKELQWQREALGLSRNDIERQIKIRELYVYALENGQIEELPSSVQGRGMLNNYAAFMSLDPEPLQTRFAEGLQQRRLEKTAEEIAKKKSPELKKYNAPITGWRRYLTPDLLIGGGVFAVLFILIIWGALQVIGSSHQNTNQTVEPISNILIATETPELATEVATQEIDLTATLLSGGEVINTASVDLLATITAVGNTPIQVVVVAYQRAFLKVVSDNKEVYNGRVVPGNVYTFTGSSKITLTSGNAAAMQIYYNQQDLGILGSNGQVLNLDFSGDTMVTVTPQFTAMPTSTPVPTNTQLPTKTPTVTATPELPTITPYRP